MKSQKGSAGTTILIVVVAILVIWGIWYWSKSKNTLPANNSAAATQADVQSIENDLGAIDTTGGDSVKAIDATKTQ